MKCFIDFQKVVFESNFEDKILLRGEECDTPHFYEVATFLSEFKIPKKWFDSKINHRIDGRECLGT